MKNITRMLLVLALVPALVIGGSREEFYEKHNSKNMSGWKGIVFICSFDPSDKVLEKICRRAETDIELLAASSKVAIKIADANKFEQAAFIAAVDKFVTLEYELMATQHRGSYDAKAVHARLAFETFYSNAVEKDSRSNTIDNMPRSGDLELWSKSVIGSGVPADIVEPVSDGAETHIKKALTLFLKYEK